MEQQLQAAAAHARGRAAASRAALVGRASAASAAGDDAAAQRCQQASREVAAAAEGHARRRKRARDAKVALLQRHADGRREALRLLLHGDPAAPAAAVFVPDGAPPFATLAQLPAADAVAEVSKGADGLFEALSTVALRGSAQAEDGALPEAAVGAFRAACSALGASLSALAARLRRAVEEAPAEDAALEALLDEGGGGEEEARGWERQLGTAVQAQLERRRASGAAAVRRVASALRRRG
ncbi:unnamed protein product, partial [Prorocentrum cordatum]